MKETIFKPRERRFLAASAVVMACIVGWALWCAVPLSGGQETTAHRNSAQEPLRDAFRVDLNTAGQDALATLPGIGEQKAKAILEYRRIHGSFRQMEEVAQVPGITQDMIDEWQDIAYLS